MNRRNLIKRSAALAGIGSLAGCNFGAGQSDRKPADDGSETPAGTSTTPDGAEPSRYGISFGNVVDAVADLGMDPEGNEPIDDALASTLDRGDTLVEFPPGTYYFAEEHRVDSVTNWGIRGLGDEPGDVRFVTTPGEGRYLVRTDGGLGQLVENITLDYSAERKGSTGLVLRADDKIRVQDVEYVGYNPQHGDGSKISLVPMALKPDGKAVVDGLVRTGPTDIVSHGHLDGNSNDSCIWLGNRHKGELVIRNSHIENTGTNAIYASRTPGPVKILDSTFRNNNQTSLRIGGSGALVRNCQFVIDIENAHPDSSDFINPHSIVWETGELGQAGGRIEQCSFTCRSAPQQTMAAVWVDGSAGAFEIRDCEFDIQADGVQAIRIDDPRDPRLGAVPEKPWRATLRNVTAIGSSYAEPAIQLTGRPQSKFVGLYVDWSPYPHGILLLNTEEILFENSTIQTMGSEIITMDATCHAPKGTSLSTCSVASRDSS
ncbi:right-handed parallel beta-helix repeat-containing protein [Halobellus sp. H-GB7]|uniref:right-handed parallel beta-helix repeat-containing protein n=1 Tax=Halobellus sp. H-GB7 TaxID=3069756 RepID=UPI0027B86C7D|nr:right-handed parallel beta-helix repeat-containing protein [Halobellus sp. H-GB7]MDQ2054463.1 right-handed parallel beta-helix repeat-containing protein [Halobellus sp. H-GB7]